MNGIDKITEKIASDAASDEAAVLAQARAESEKLKAEAVKAAKSEAEAVIAAAAEAEAAIRRQQEGVSELESRKALLAAKNETIESAFAQALERLLSMPDDDYILLLSRLAANAAVTGREEMILSSADRELRGGAIVEAANDIRKKHGQTADIRLSAETREIGGGLILRDGLIETNCSFTALIETSRKDVTDEVAEVLFPQ